MDAASFDIEPLTGQIKTKSGVVYDHETTPSYSVTVRASDPTDASDTIAVTIEITNVNEPSVGARGAVGVERLDHEPVGGLDGAGQYGPPGHHQLRPAVSAARHKRNLNGRSAGRTVRNRVRAPPSRD